MEPTDRLKALHKAAEPPKKAKAVPVTHKDLLVASKAAYDGMKVLVKSALQDSEASTVSRATRLLEKALDEKIEELKVNFDQRLAELEKAYNSGLHHIYEILKALPIPRVNVTVPDHAIQIHQLPSQVHLPKDSIKVDVTQASPEFHFPKDAIKVEVDQKPSTVNIPKDAINVQVHQEASHVHLPKDSIRVEVHQEPSVVNIPEGSLNVHMDAPQIMLPQDSIKVEVSQKPVKVTVEQLPRKERIVKNVEYDPQTGRPTRITEESED